MWYIFSFFVHIVLILSVILTYLSINIKKTAMETIKDMGFGINLGNTFDCYSQTEQIKSPDEQITLWGNVKPTKVMFSNIKKNGFKTVRFPVTWRHFIDSNGKVSPDWMSRVKEVVNWITKNKMYCILNIHHDGSSGNWLSQGLKVKDKYINLWSQIAEEFKEYNEYLIFESMNEVEYLSNGSYDFLALLSMTQAFVDTVRNSGGKNGDRLLIIAGANGVIDSTCSSDYKLPIDPSNKIAISMHYYNPTQFCLEPDDDPWKWKDDNGEIQFVQPMTTWGDEGHYNDMIADFENIKRFYLDKGIPVVLDEVGILTEQRKEKKSIREYFYSHLSLFYDYGGIMACIWDTSKKTAGNMNFYNRETNKWYDPKIRDYLYDIKKGKYVKPTQYFIISPFKTVFEANPDGNFNINIGRIKVIRVIFNAYIIGDSPSNVGFGLATSDKNGAWSGDPIWGGIGKKDKENTYTFTIDVREKDYNNYIQLQKWWGNEHITINYLTIELEESVISIDYKPYKNAISSVLLD